MAGVFPFEAVMEPRLRSLGYREVVTRRDSLLGPSGTAVRGHEFHYSRMSGEEAPVERIYTVTGRLSGERTAEGFSTGGVIGSYIHLHWGSNPKVPRAFVEACAGPQDPEA